ncbi:MAG: selenide, water dikinase SelD [Paracoccaceae bacterium]
MQMPTPITRDILLVGGGHSHALLLRMWGMAPIPGVRLTLINPGPTAAYSGMLPGHIAGHYPREALEIDLVRLARFAGARVILGLATGIDRQERRVRIAGRADAAYDLLSIDIGVTSQMPDLPGFVEHAVAAKPLDGFADRWQAFVEAAAAGLTPPKVAIIGAGLAGVELALAARTRLGPDATVTLIEAREPLAQVGQGARAALLAHLDRAGVDLLVGSPAASIAADHLVLADGRRIEAALTIGAAGAAAHRWLATTGLALQDGFVRVGPTLQSESDPLIFAVGDAAHFSADPRPKAGVFAVRQAPVLLNNLRALVTGKGRLCTYRPQRDYLKLVSTGGKGAVADKWGLRLDGPLLWRWKDRIDQTFMEKFRTLPTMAMPESPAPPPADDLSQKPLCGGCGAKAGRPALDRALADLPPPGRADVVKGAGDDAAILRHGSGFQVITTDHLRAFTADPWLMARITAIHALGDIWSMGAAPQVALAQVILPLMAERQQAETLREILAGAQSVLAPEGVDLVGGHTSLGAEMTIGFSLTGTAETSPLTHGGAKAGDVLILTKPIGTGVILAAEMAGQAPGRQVAAALASMNRPQGKAARLLRPHAHAMTDVTGFGLAGHLMSILEASALSAEIDLGQVPLLDGALDLAKAGAGSSLLPSNRAIANRMKGAEGPLADLLFDPQTAGGLLAAVPAARAEGILTELTKQGEAAARIGRLSDGAPFIHLLP